MKGRAYNAFLFLTPFFWLFIFFCIFFFFGRVKAAPASPPEFYVTQTPPLLTVPQGATKKEKDFYFFGYKVFQLFSRCYYHDEKIVFYEVVRTGTDMVLWRRWQEEDGTYSAALRRIDGAYIVARDAYIILGHGPQSKGEITLKVRLMKILSPTIVFAVSNFSFKIKQEAYKF